MNASTPARAVSVAAAAALVAMALTACTDTKSSGGHRRGQRQPDRREHDRAHRHPDTE